MDSVDIQSAQKLSATISKFLNSRRMYFNYARVKPIPEEFAEVHSVQKC